MTLIVLAVLAIVVLALALGPRRKAPATRKPGSDGGTPVAFADDRGGTSEDDGGADGGGGD